MKEQILKKKIVNVIIDNCEIELDNTGQERYSLNEKQFGDLVSALLSHHVK